jgi:iron complex transport system permease protein
MSYSPPIHTFLAARRKRLLLGFFLIGLLLVCLFVLDLLLGSVSIPLRAFPEIFAHSPDLPPGWRQIIFDIRLPKACTALLAGAALAVSGLQLQTLFRNPLASPSVLGISAGAALGVALVMMGLGGATTLQRVAQVGLSGAWLIVAAASAGAALVLLVVLWVSYRIKDQVVILIVGLMIANITTSVVSIWQYFSEPELIRDYLMWTFGSLGGVSGDLLAVLALVVAAGFFGAFLLSKPLNALLLGEAYARSIGQDVQRVKMGVIITTSLLAGAVTGFCGPIAFIGIAVPHLTRALLHTANHHVLSPACAGMGAVVLLACDIVAHLPGYSSVLPINAVTALVGSPVVIWVIIRRNKISVTT